MRTKRARKLAAVLLGAGIAAGSRVRVSHWGTALHVNPTLHYAVHLAAFALLTVLLVASTNSRKAAWLLFCAVLLFGFGTEFYEHLKDGYPIESADVLVDTLGACTGFAAWHVVRVRTAEARRSR